MDVPDYTEDWKTYWEFRYNNRLRKRLKKAAENPSSQYLPVKPTELNPEPEEYDWSIENDHLRNYPDTVLEDAKSGFAEFVLEEELTVERENNYDILPINFTDRSFDLDGYFFRPSNMDHVRPNQISSIGGTLLSPPDISQIAAVISYQCPKGHQNGILQPVYTNRLIETCPEEDCTNSVYQISRGTELIDIVEFKIEFDGSELHCVANGLYTTERALEEVTDGDQGLQLHGILRNVISDEGGPKEIFEVLSMDG